MPPPKVACQVGAAAGVKTAKLLDQIEKVTANIWSLCAQRTSIKWGDVLPAVDNVGSELLNSIESSASTIAKNVLGAISQTASSLFEQILSSILKIIMSAPQALFSFVVFPHKRAITHVKRERESLVKATQNLNTINSIIRRWTKSNTGYNYYDQMVKANPYIQLVIDTATSMISDLDIPSNPGFTIAPHFDQSKYSNLQYNLLRAIELTKTQSLNNFGFNIESSVEKDRKRIYDENIKKVNEEYIVKKKQITKSYISKISDASKNTSSKRTQAAKIESAAVEDGLKIDYQFQLEKLDAWKELKTNQVKADAEYKSRTNMSNYIETYKGLMSKFNYDMIHMMKELSEYYENVKSASKNYFESLDYCNKLYNIRQLLRGNLLNGVLYLMRKSSSAAIDVAINQIERVKAMSEMVHDMYQKEIDKYKNYSVTDSEMCLKLNNGHQILLTANANLDAVITKSLIDMINSNELLTDKTGEFNDFIKRLGDIKDFGGKPGWVKQLDGATVANYYSLIADTVTMTEKLPSACTSKNEKDRSEIDKLFSRVRNDLRSLLTHNSAVYNVLNSYVPYASSEAAELIAMLQRIGCLEEFSKSLSVLIIGAKIAKDTCRTFSGGFLQAIPTYSNCKSAYPDIYKDESTNEALAKSSIKAVLNIPSGFVHYTAQAKAEKNAQNIMSCINVLHNTDFNADVEDSDLIDDRGIKDNSTVG